MSLNASTALPYSVDKVLGAFTNEDFVRHTSKLVGGSLTSFSLSGNVAEAFELTVVRTLPTGWLPEMARKFVGETLNLTQVEKWSAPAADGSRSADMSMSVAGVPISAKALQRLVPEAAGTRVELTGEVSSGIPFLGGKIASMAEPMIGKALNMQSRQAQAWLEKQD